LGRLSLLRYHPILLKRFLLLALPLLVLTMGLFQFALEHLGRAPNPALLSPATAPHLPAWVVLGTWLLESIGLAALYLLLHGGGGGRMLNGLLTGWIAWVFRGPLLVVTVVTLGGLPAGPWWSLALGWWVLYSICGLLLGVTAAASGLQT